MADTNKQDIKELHDKLSELTQTVTEFVTIQKEMVKKMDKRDEVLFGRDGRSGLVGDVTAIKTTGKIAKAFLFTGAGSGIISFLGMMWAKVMGKG